MDTREKIQKALKPQIKTLNIKSSTKMPKQEIKAFQMMFATDWCEQYLAGLIDRQGLIVQLQSMQMDNFQITKLIKSLDEIKVL